MTNHAITIYPELDRYRDLQFAPPASDNYGPAHPDILFRLATQGLLPPPTAYFSATNSMASGVSGSPSTRFSESPGPGPYSRDTTPTSMSSQSPGLVASVRMPSVPRMRPPVRGRAGSFGKDSAGGTGGPATAPTQTLAAIRESLNSSSSSSNGTVRGNEKKKEVKKKRLSPMPPSPPPRKSSQKFKTSDEAKESPAKSQHASPVQSSQPLASRKFALQPEAPKNVTATAIPRQRQPAVTSPRSHQTAAPPRRPSRDGTPDLQPQLLGPRPVIQSNLAYTPLSDHNDGSRSIASSASSLDQGRHIYDQRSSPSPSQSLQPFGAGRTAAVAPQHEPVFIAASPDLGSWSGSESRARGAGKEQGRSIRTPSPSVSTFRTRFALFGRKTKTIPSTVETEAAAELKETSTKKGPAAGTGHEGYGRLGSSRRRSSSVSNFLRGTVSSQESLSSSQPQDPFLRDRLSPVVIAGGEVVENLNTGYDMTRTHSNTSSATSASAMPSFRRPSTDSRADSQMSMSSREDRSTLWPSAIARDARQMSPLRNGGRRPSDSSDSEALMKSSLALRRSMQRLKSPDQAQVRMPRPIIVRPPRGGASSSVNSLDTSVMTDSSIPDTHIDTGRGRKGSLSNDGPAVKKKLTKRARSPRKWNLFGRSQSQPATAKKALQSTSTVAVTVEAARPADKTKPVAFYAMIDSSEQEDGDMDIEDVLRDARVFDSPMSMRSGERNRRPSIEQHGFGDEKPASSKPGFTAPVAPHLVAAPSREQTPRFQPQPQVQPQPRLRPPPALQPGASSSTVSIRQQPSAEQGVRSGRPSRLPQVGRIPKVVSARPEPASPRSFSRPFQRASINGSSTFSPPLNSLDSESVAKGPSPPKSGTPELMPDGSTVTGSTAADSAALRFRLSRNLTPDTDSAYNGNEFFAFSPHEDSQTTSHTSSSGLLSFADATAVVPDTNAPLVEDEIWDEYNDLLGDEATKSVPLSATSSQGLPFHLEVASRALPTATKNSSEQKPAASLESPTIAVRLRKTGRVDETVQSSRPPISSSVYSADNDEIAKDNVETRSSALTQLPSTPFSVSEFVSGYGDRNNSGIKAKKRATSKRSSSSSQQSGKRRTRVSDGSVYSQVSEDNSPISQVNLRVGSMTVSKWLTFGHVLFSPARDDMILAVKPPNGHSVLVIDGLGNDDWSFYAAETYPAATFFNLSPRAPLPVQQGGAASFPISPPNHHQIQYTSQADRLPFQSEIFTTVVYRFPQAGPESHYRNIINEARRVLKPGGYLELSVLGLDLHNMGNRTRRAIRHLKEQIHTQRPDMHLGSAADVILRILGARGFTDVKSCRVGVPVAGLIRQAKRDPSAGDAKQSLAGEKPKKDQRSLAEMINDESAVADESITNMVARVGRWWHSRCYGDAVMDLSQRPQRNATASSDMWMDRALLAECEQWHTNLKLMVCYARVPDSKRVASI